MQSLRSVSVALFLLVFCGTAFAAPKLSMEEQAFFSHKAETKEFAAALVGIGKQILRLQEEEELPEAKAYELYSEQAKLFGGLFLFARENTPKACPVQQSAACVASAIRVVERYYGVFTSRLSIEAGAAPLKSSDDTVRDVLQAIVQGFPGEKLNEPLLKTLERTEALFLGAAEYTSAPHYIEAIRRKATQLNSILSNPEWKAPKGLPTPRERYAAFDASYRALWQSVQPKDNYGETAKLYEASRKPRQWGAETSSLWMTCSHAGDMKAAQRVLVTQTSAKDGSPLTMQVISKAESIQKLQALSAKPKEFAELLEVVVAAHAKSEGALTFEKELSGKGNEWVYRLDTFGRIGLTSPVQHFGARRQLALRITPKGRVVLYQNLYSLTQIREGEKLTSKLLREELELDEVLSCVSDPK